ncbi:hypothetical protein E2562_013671 [Oryza meyeriana var. granulata]|uniref:Uncharacterized protein n=1 Tax=Oryza meyeriana var. granulata TaxID=110450 RepID=A0A6G1BJY3_9ORYZ|nr:hypothetical protein E2562_013671 [Oryza meyeriana var. granulata]
MASLAMTQQHGGVVSEALCRRGSPQRQTEGGFGRDELQASIEDVKEDIPKLPNIIDLRINVALSMGTMDRHTIGGKHN